MGDGSAAVIRVRRRPKWGDVLKWASRCERVCRGSEAWNRLEKMNECTHTGPILGEYPSRLSFLHAFIPPLHYLLITVHPFHWCMNEPPPSFCLHTAVDSYHLATTTAS
ncbi:hypothetical protein Y032_0049g1783 [Ancylostoma ceylanicum]|uniref:Uncharacterized protein n=1 Tax=Ancylostoma ceylanicum TaxID=53326 RepID=A0A016UB13_9BILA|nr:hypothetical protein Y032_0049g1783 [Ancylostoma ceylanicum]